MDYDRIIARQAMDWTSPDFRRMRERPIKSDADFNSRPEKGPGFVGCDMGRSSGSNKESLGLDVLP